MCGITGILNLDKTPVSLKILKRMTDIVAHRGPDASGFWQDTYVGFGHRRLSVIDLSPLANQPMQTKDGNIIITYNGELYNFQNLKIELTTKGYHFFSNSDTEVILNSYMEWGKDCVSKFNGMFAFVIWDKRNNNLFLARDRYGVKPLYYFANKKYFLFGSEIKSLLQHPGVKVNLSLYALNEYFSFQNIFSDLTLFQDIKILPPGTTLTISSEGITTLHKYWDYFFYEDHTITAQSAEEETTRIFQQAVNRQLISDVEIGTYLSGGMDSGAITCITAQNISNPKSFTCGFDLSSASGLELSFDERKKAEYLSNLYKTEHYEIVLKAGDMERAMPKLIWHLEDLRVGQSYPNYYVSRLASKFLKVVLAGTGGDEVFAGYPWRYYQAVVNDMSDNYLLKYYKYWQRLIPDHVKPEFYNYETYKQIKDHHTIDIFKSVMYSIDHPITTPEEYINKSLYFESKTFLHGLLIVEDKLSMAHGLETRVPFLDNDLVDFAMKIPVKYKLQNLKKIVRLNENETGRKTQKYYEQTNDGKVILRKVLGNFVPNGYTNGKKQGFSAPDASWFKGESIDYIKNTLLAPKARIYDYLQPKKVQSLMNEHFEGKKNRRLFIWSLLCFEQWLKTFM